MNFQQTLKSAVSIDGIGLHSGQPVTITLRPARPNSGIQFVRTDLVPSVQITAHYKNVVNTQLATTLGRGSVQISTVEHVLAALELMGIDNVIAEVTGPEVPILDGSAVGFCDAIEAAGIQTQLQSRPMLMVRRSVELKIAGKWAIAEPSSRLEVHETVEWDHPAIGFQEFHYIEGQTSYDELASARTFGFLRDVENLKKMGLARGGSLDNAVVLDDFSILNSGGLRYSNEFVRHKVLDALGDFKLSGIGIKASVRLHRAGHDLHSQLISAIFANPDNYEIVESVPREERLRQTRVGTALGRRLATI